MVLKKEGIPIKDMLDNTGTDLKKTDVLRIGLRMIKILEKLHDAGVIHRDI